MKKTFFALTVACLFGLTNVYAQVTNADVLAKKKLSEISAVVRLNADMEDKALEVILGYYKNLQEGKQGDSDAEKERVELLNRNLMNNLESILGEEYMETWMTKQVEGKVKQQTSAELNGLDIDATSLAAMYQKVYSYNSRWRVADVRYKYDANALQAKRNELRLQKPKAAQIKTDIKRRYEELEKIVVLNDEQKSLLLKTVEKYYITIALQQDPSGHIADDVKASASKILFEDYMRILSEQQQMYYLQSVVEESVKNQTTVQLKGLALDSNAYSQIYKLAYGYNLEWRMAEFRYKYNTEMLNIRKDKLRKQKPKAAQIKIDAVRKCSSIESIVSLSPEQQIAVQKESEKYFINIALQQTPSLEIPTAVKENADRIFFKDLMSILDDQQQKKYLQSLVENNVQAQTNAKVNLLAENGNLTGEELEAERAKIYVELMEEKMQNVRYKYGMDHLNVMGSQGRQRGRKFEKGANHSKAAEKRAATINTEVKLDDKTQDVVKMVCLKYYSVLDSTKSAQDPNALNSLENKFMDNLEEAMGTQLMNKWLMVKIEPKVRYQTSSQLKDLDIDSRVYTILYDLAYAYNLKWRMLETRYKYNPEVLNEKRNELRKEKPKAAQIAADASRKCGEVEKVVNLNDNQKQSLLKLTEKYYVNNALLQSNQVASLTKEENDKMLLEGTLGILNEKQQMEYLKGKAEKDVLARTTEKMNLLKNTESMTTEEQKDTQSKIYNALLAERIARERYRYDKDKQEEVLSMLKKQQPMALRKANSLERNRRQGKQNAGEYRW